MAQVGLVLLVLLAVALDASADDKAVQRFRNLTPEQVRDLSEKVRSSELPIMYTFAAQRGLAKGADLLFGMELNALMYPGLHDYRAAVKAFQGDLGDDATGILTVWQIHQLEQRAGMQRLGTVSFPTQFSSFAVDGYASIKGTMVLLDEKIAWPVNHTRITCSRATMSCDLDQVHLAFPDSKSWAQVYQVLQSPTETFEVIRWQGNTVDAVKPETSTACRALSLSLDLKAKEFFYITRNGTRDCEVAGTKMPRLAKPRIAQIVDGTKVIESTFEELSAAAFKVLSSDFRRRVEQLRAAEGKK